MQMFRGIPLLFKTNVLKPWLQQDRGNLQVILHLFLLHMVTKETKTPTDNTKINSFKYLDDLVERIGQKSSGLQMTQTFR